MTNIINDISDKRKERHKRNSNLEVSGIRIKNRYGISFICGIKNRYGISFICDIKNMNYH